MLGGGGGGRGGRFPLSLRDGWLACQSKCRLDNQSGTCLVLCAIIAIHLSYFRVKYTYYNQRTYSIYKYINILRINKRLCRR
jgi:hypothetical protein